jgi:hypothetical protein
MVKDVPTLPTEDNRGAAADVMDSSRAGDFSMRYTKSGETGFIQAQRIDRSGRS